KESILNSDYIIIGPGDLYSSVVPNLLIEGIKDVLNLSKGKVIYVCNIMTKRGETNNFGVEDFVDVIEKYIGTGRIDYVLVNNGWIDEELVEKYKLEEGKKPVKIKDLSAFEGKTYKIVERDLLDEEDYIRHNPKKLAQAIKDFVDEWIK
ncbi:MAG: 2-phospho-L-lactate transferase CofD family protein, partial [Candidatus Gracilibacteria bacterium]|nr:2-phospho-L-lactate transferase CofD family protein [Candidatus Gracilibacteria bacterium]